MWQTRDNELGVRRFDQNKIERGQMKFKNCVNWMGVLVTVITLCLTGCGGSRTLVYRATGTATEAKVVYTDADGNTQEETVTLPWETSVEFTDPAIFY
jgi:hypothetical protein